MKTEEKTLKYKGVELDFSEPSEDKICLSKVEDRMLRLWSEASKSPAPEWIELRSLTESEKQKTKEFWDNINEE